MLHSAFCDVVCWMWLFWCALLAWKIEASPDSCLAGAESGASADSCQLQAARQEPLQSGSGYRLVNILHLEDVQPNATAETAEDIHYGRALLRIPVADLITREALQEFLPKDEPLLHQVRDIVLSSADDGFGSGVVLPDPLSSPAGRVLAPTVDAIEVALGLILKKRQVASGSTQTETVLAEWFEAVSAEQLPVLKLDAQQVDALRGTTVQDVPAAMNRSNEILKKAADTCGLFHAAPLLPEEAAWALSVVASRAFLVGSSTAAGTSEPWLAIVPLKEILKVPWHHSAENSFTFNERPGPGNARCIVWTAKRDMDAGEAVFALPGSLSSSEAALVHGTAVGGKSPIGLGGQRSFPRNWNANPNTPIFGKYAKFNCTGAAVFEMRFSSKGWPMRRFVRCHRIAWLLANGIDVESLTGRLQELDKWPPPHKYDHADWLAWTQADQDVNAPLTEYCGAMRDRLRSSLTTSTADALKSSSSSLDKLIWGIRVAESQAFKECDKLAKATAPRAR